MEKINKKRYSRQQCLNENRKLRSDNILGEEWSLHHNYYLLVIYFTQ